MANQMGKRYVCANCGSEMLVTRAGEGPLSCCGQAMELRGQSSTPAAESQSKPQEAKRG